MLCINYFMFPCKTQYLTPDVIQSKLIIMELQMKKNVFIFLIITLLLIFSGTVSAQSRYLEDGIGGPGFKFNLGIINYELSSFGMASAYSIGGIMDIGFFANRETGTLRNKDRTDINLGFLYNVIIVKQTEYVPFNLQLEGSYGYTNVESDALLGTREGQGFNLGLSVYSEVMLFSKLGILVGGKGLYKNYIFTETVPVSRERIEGLEFGFLSGISLKLDKWPIISLGVEVLYTIPDPGISVKPTLSIVNPSY